MSGNRSLHRELVLPHHSVWSVATTPILTRKPASKRPPSSWRLWVGSSNGQVIQTFVVDELSLETKAADLNASAVKLSLTHELVSQSHSPSTTRSTPSGSDTSILGCSSISIVRNYTGEDDDAGDYVVMALELAGRVRLWSLPQDWDDAPEPMPTPDSTDTSPLCVQAHVEFLVDHATGTSAALCPPRIAGRVGDLMVAVPCLDGTIAMVATGLATPSYTKEPSSPGTILDSWGSRGSSLPLSLHWHPKQAHVLAVGRKDGSVELLTESRKNQHRMAQHTAPVRAVAFTDDGHLLVSGSDAGTILVWDVSRPVPALVHHVMEAHASWILSLTTLPDSRRFLTSGADQSIRLWNTGQMHQAVHAFQTDAEVWTMARGPMGAPGVRLVTGSEDGHIQVYSLEK